MDHSGISASEEESAGESVVPAFPPLFPSDHSSPPNREGAEIKIRSAIVALEFGGKITNVEVFTLTLGDETIQLLPQRNWTQLDSYKWSAQGKLPGQPSGLEVGLDEVHFCGQTLSPRDPEAREKLERLLNDWLVAERESTRKRASNQLPVTAPEPPPQPAPTALRFTVEVDKRGQVHVNCIQAKQTLTSIGLTAAGVNSLVQQGFMRKPQRLHIGVLHDWIELDGELCSFEKGKNDAKHLEQILNERYLPSKTFARGNEILVLVNAASATGFDVQFPAIVGGMPGKHRSHLDEQSLELLQDKQRCGLLNPDIIIKLIAPNLVFKQRTPEGGEQYLARHPDNVVLFTDEDGREKKIDLSQPVNFLHISAPELRAIFNHPGICRDAKNSPARRKATAPARLQVNHPNPQVRPPISRAEATPQSARLEQQPVKSPVTAASPDDASRSAVEKPKPLPNLWLNDPFSKSPVRHEWLAPLAYRKMAEHFEQSSEGIFGASPCWFISLNGNSDMNAQEFKGLFLTEKGGLGFLSKGQIARFNNGVAFLGKVESAHEGIGINLVGLGVNNRNQIAFIVTDDYRRKFELPAQTLNEILTQFRECGAAILSISELLADGDRLERIWTLPAEQPDPDNPEVIELKPSQP